MRISRIQVQNFRKLIDRVDIENLSDGINVIVGDNEDGKSTIFQALRTVLFDRHTITGDAADAMQPFGHRVRPEISLHFEVDGAAYELTKGFCQRPSAQLKTPTGILAGAEVEEKLQELLRFRPPGRGPSRPEENHGICALFWVEQGCSFAPISLNVDNRGALTGALEGEVGQVLGGARGRTLKEAIAKQYRKFFTEATGRERGPLVDAARAVDEITQKVAPLKDQLRQYESKVDQLAESHERLARHQSEGTLANAQAELRKAQKRKDEVDALQRDVQLRRTAKELADAGTGGPALALQQRQEAVARAARDAGNLSDANAELKLADQDIETCNSDFQSAAVALSESECRLEEAEHVLRQASRVHERKGLEGEAKRFKSVLGDVRAAETLERNARARAALAKVDAVMLRQLRGLQEKRVQAEATLEGSSTLVRIRFERDGLAQIAGTVVPREGEISIVEPTVIEISGVGSLSITPGGKELAERRTAAERAVRQLHEGLQKAGVVSFAQAETVWENAEKDRQQAEKQAGIVAALAPDGIEALESRLAQVETGLSLSKAPPDEVSEVKSLDEAREEHRLASEKATRDRRERERKQVALSAARECRAGAQASVQLASTAVVESVTELKSARDLQSDDALREASAAAGRQAAVAASGLASAEEALREAKPERCLLEFERANDSLAAITTDIDVLERSAEDLAIELRALGQRGLGEEVQELEGELELASSKQKKLAREAVALKLLYDTICRAEKRAREAFLAPVQARVEPYLRLLLPDTKLVLSDTDLGITHLRRAGHDEPYDTLSIGVREQIAVLTRLAFADLLREQGFSAPVILDDALVNSDPQRFESMLLAIRRASKDMQIIVLTCHEASWIRAGAPIIRLTACVRS